MYRRAAAAVLALSLLAPGTVAAQNSAQEAADEVRTLVRALDPHTAYRIGEKSLHQFPDSAQLRAWWITAGARAGREAESLKAARAFVDSFPEQGWAWFALAATELEALDLRSGAVNSSARAMDALGTHPDVVRLHSRAMLFSGRPDEAITIIEKAAAESGPVPGLLQIQASAEFAISRNDPSYLERAIATARSAIDLGRDEVDVIVGAAEMLQRAGEPTVAVELFARAERLAPRSISVRQAVWSGNRRRDDLTADQKLAVILEDAEQLIAMHERAPAALYSAWRELDGTAASDHVEPFAEEILSEYPDSREAEGVLVGRYRALGRQLRSAGLSPDQPISDTHLETLRRYREALNAFLSRPSFHRPVFIGDAYQNLFQVSELGIPPSDKELLRCCGRDGGARADESSHHVSRSRDRAR